MKLLRSLAIFFFALASVATAEAGILGWLTSDRRDWQFVQNIGGIRIGTVHEVAGKKVLPVEYDVSGLTTITRKPITLNSGLTVRKVTATRRSGCLVIQVITQVVDAKSEARSTHLVDISDIPFGTYQVFYEKADDPEKRLGQITLK
jgi:hypothetical protein